MSIDDLKALLLADPRRPGFLLGLAGAGALASAFTFQALGFEPCQLCVWQRWPFAALIVLAAVAVPFRGTRAITAALLVVGALAMFGNSGLAFYHTGVEQHWWSNVFDCSGGATAGAGSAADLSAMLLAHDFVPCDKIPWELFGISIAGYNVLASAVLGVFAAVTARLVWTR